MSPNSWSASINNSLFVFHVYGVSDPGSLGSNKASYLRGVRPEFLLV